MDDEQTKDSAISPEPQATDAATLKEHYPQLANLAEQDGEGRIEAFRSVLSGLRAELDSQ
ncbi:hypothetical protein PT282_03515 [Bifidobacterium sp. ESL0763]|uniref:hypothetical protein n=1 Tax=Bifidobacterium sp. ESL0763 TaxID=2983227 RepID=UPI0023FA38E7|nr:hypothetical protein [Bifidobacterium sp. ESL0763]MDF7663737.1 hypothetical protein [Bifidobacterium sp. ESL0763]